MTELENTTNHSDKAQRGCLMRLLGWGFRQVLLVVMGFIMIYLTFTNLGMASIFNEACGYVHPLLFEVSVEAIDTEQGERLPFGANTLGFIDPPDISEIGGNENFIPIFWESCLQYYGFANSNGDFQLNLFGEEVFYFTEFVFGDELYQFYIRAVYNETTGEKQGYAIFDDNHPDESEIPVEVTSKVVLSELGIVVLYLLFPSLLIVMPIFTILLLRQIGVHWWAVMILLVAAQSLTASLLYIHLADISGINTLQEFGIGIFTGVVTGTALAFMGKVLERFS